MWKKAAVEYGRVDRVKHETKNIHLRRKEGQLTLLSPQSSIYQGTNKGYRVPSKSQIFVSLYIHAQPHLSMSVL